MNVFYQDLRPHAGLRIITAMALVSPGTQVINWNTGEMFINEADIYKWIFFNNVVDDRTVGIACEYAKDKLNKYINAL